VGHGASPGACGTVPDSVVPTSGGQRHQRRRRLGRLAPAAPTAPGEASTAAAACFPEPDPLVLEPCAGAGPPAWVDPMLEELTASLVVSRPAGPTTPWCPTTPAGASLTMDSPSCRLSWRCRESCLHGWDSTALQIRRLLLRQCGLAIRASTTRRRPYRGPSLYWHNWRHEYASSLRSRCSASRG